MRTTMSVPMSLFGAAAMLLCTACRADAPPSSVWKKHEYSFVAMGFTSTYSCDGLADKLRTLLLAAGARSDAKVRPGACPGGFGQPEKMARAQLTFHTLEPAPDTAAESERVKAEWKPVAFGIDKPRQLGRGDCELVEQFATGVLPMFSTRNLVNHTSCVPHQNSGSHIDVRFESLSAPKAAAKAKNPD